MDFLDPKKQRSHLIRLISGYVLVGIAILIGTLILLYQAYGFGLAKDGEVIQNGLVFVSSQPNGAQVYIDGKLYKSATNTKLQVPEGSYNIELRRQGYDSWLRTIGVEGGSLQHFDYPMLFPTKLTTTNVKSYAAAPGFASQSPDRRWMLVQQDAVFTTFDLFDIANPDNVTTEATELSLPEAQLTAPKAGLHGWKLVEWSTDNRHLLVQHTYAGVPNVADGSEYITIDRQNPDESVNLTRLLGLTVTKQLTLRDKKFDLFYVHDTTTRQLGTMSIDDTSRVTSLLDQVLAYKSYGANSILYVTDQGAEPGKVVTMLREGDDANDTYKIREHGTEGPFLVDLARYDGDWYVVVGASGDDRVYVYKNPQRIRKASNTAALVPVRVLRVDAPTFLSFSSNTQFIMLENGSTFSNYDIENDKGYNFTAKQAIDPPLTHAAWMDGHRVSYVSGSKLTVFDYDNTNSRTLMPASANYTPFFDRDYSFVYTLVPAADGAAGMTLTSTALRTPADL